MIVLNKKRILLITGSEFIGLLSFTFCLNQKNDIKNDYVPTVSLPVSGKTVVVDARTRSTR